MLNNNENQQQNARLAPRISFSNDFVETNQMVNQRTTPSEGVSSSSSSDFEFSVTNYNMMAADVLFSEGKLLPYNPSHPNNQFQPKMTLRDELLQGEDEERGAVSSSRPPKGPSRWKELLGLKRSHIVSKKADKRSVSEEGMHVNVNNSSSQETLTDG